MHALWLYRCLARLGFLSYRGKIMIIAFVGTHIPLIALAIFLVRQSAPDWSVFFATVGVTLIATLIGTCFTLFMLHQLLRPVVLTSDALRLYRKFRQQTALPTMYTDEVGILMADADATINHLEHARDALEHIDEATGLPNREKLLQLMERRTGLGLPFTIAVVRFSNFSRVAEAVDLARANKAAASLAARLEKRAEPGEILARIGQSDFALFWAQRGDDSDQWSVTTDRLRSLMDDCAQALPLDAVEIKPVLLCGVARFPHDANETEILLDHAVSAAAQATPETPVILHSAAARQAAFERLTIEQELRRALDHSEFFLHYQPVVDIDLGRVVGAEALIRWNHPDRGPILPDTFIPTAEASGLIEPMGKWVMHKACEQLRAWNTHGPHAMRIAINLSSRQFLDANLSAHVALAIANAGIDAQQIELELTETSAMLDLSHTQRMFSRLRDLGVSIAIDDFGTGYASMSYLRKLPFDKLKIDREFVTDVHKRSDGQAICRSLIALSQGLDLEILSEGTEKAEEVGYLSAEGCNLFQGYFFAKPLGARDFAQACRTIPTHLARSYPRIRPVIPASALI